MKQLGGLDAAMVYLESKDMPLHMGGMLIYDPSSAPGGKVTAAQVVEWVRSRLGRAQSFRQRVAKVPFDLDLPYWFEGDVDVQHHVSHEPLAAPGDWRQLCEQASRFLERPLDMSRPLWELHLIEGLDDVEGVAPGSFAMVMKVHHAVVDGVAGIELLGALHDAEPIQTDPTAEEPWVVERPSWLRLLGMPLVPGLRIRDGEVAVAVPDVAVRPLRLLGIVGEAGAGYVRRLASSERPPVTPAPEGRPELPTTRFGGPLGPGRTVGGVSFSLADIKQIKQAVPGTTVNDVVLTVVGGALRAYLGEADGLPPVSLVAVMPMSARTKEHEGVAGNRFSLSTVALGTDVPDAADRLASVHVAASQVKEVVRSTTARSTARVVDAVPAGVLGMAARLMPLIDMSSRVRLVNTGVTNVPGSRVPTYLCGAKLSALYGYAVIVPGVGLMHMATSNDGSLTIGFQAGTSMLPDPEKYEQCLRASLDELRVAVTGQDAGAGAER